LQPPPGPEREPQARQVFVGQVGQVGKVDRVFGERWRVLPKVKPFEPSPNVARHRQSLRQFGHNDAEGLFEVISIPF
jgi:hypothetical protein